MKTISLKNLAEATEQEVFEYVARHLLTQGKLAGDDGACYYKTREGNLSCAAGCLIAEDEYDESFENKSWHGLVNLGVVPTAHHYLIVALQRLHDSTDPAHWKASLASLAVDWGLDSSFLKEFTV